MKKTVLVVDDAKFMRMMLISILTKHEYEVIGEASNAQEAIDVYPKLNPDIVTMDIVMPGDLNGIDAIRKLVQIDPAANVICVSALGQQGLIMEAIQAGARDFVNKPFKPEQVMDAFSKVAA